MKDYKYTTHTRYAITGLNYQGQRTLSLGNNGGDNHYLKREDAEKRLNDIITSPYNSVDKIKLLGDDLRIDPIECYSHGEAVGIWID